MTRLGAGSQRVIKDGLDGARAASALGTAAEAIVNLLGVAREVFRNIDGVPDVDIAQEVTGTNNHENENAPSGDEQSILGTAAGRKRKKRILKRFQTEAEPLWNKSKRWRA
jgi:hypothetical protein